MRLFKDMVLYEGKTRPVSYAVNQNSEPEVEFIAVECEHFRAKNKVQRDKYAECEYCNSPPIF